MVINHLQNPDSRDFRRIDLVVLHELDRVSAWLEYQPEWVNHVHRVLTLSITFERMASRVTNRAKDRQVIGGLDFDQALQNPARILPAPGFGSFDLGFAPLP
jgi:hypothetical protein